MSDVNTLSHWRDIHCKEQELRFLVVLAYHFDTIFSGLPRKGHAVNPRTTEHSWVELSIPASSGVIGSCRNI